MCNWYCIGDGVGYIDLGDKGKFSFDNNRTITAYFTPPPFPLCPAPFTFLSRPLSPLCPAPAVPYLPPTPPLPLCPAPSPSVCLARVQDELWYLLFVRCLFWSLVALSVVPAPNCQLL